MYPTRLADTPAADIISNSCEVVIFSGSGPNRPAIFLVDSLGLRRDYFDESAPAVFQKPLIPRH